MLCVVCNRYDGQCVFLSDVLSVADIELSETARPPLFALGQVRWLWFRSLAPFSFYTSKLWKGLWRGFLNFKRYPWIFRWSCDCLIISSALCNHLLLHLWTEKRYIWWFSCKKTPTSVNGSTCVLFLQLSLFGDTWRYACDCTCKYAPGTAPALGSCVFVKIDRNWDQKMALMNRSSVVKCVFVQVLNIVMFLK